MIPVPYAFIIHLLPSNNGKYVTCGMQVCQGRQDEWMDGWDVGWAMYNDEKRHEDVSS